MIACFNQAIPSQVFKGDKKGVTNKRTAVLKHAILAAAERAGKGDIAYLERQGEENPVTFRVVDPKDPSLIDQAMAKLRTRNMTGIVHWLSSQAGRSIIGRTRAAVA